MSTSITEYSATEAALAELTSKYGCTVYEVRTTAGMTAAKKGRAELRGWRTSLEAKRVEIKAPALERCRAIDAEAKRITAALLALEEPIDAAIKAEETRREKERAEREREAAEKLARARAAVDAIGAPLFSLAGHSSDEISEQLSATSALVVDGYELVDEARAAKASAVAKLNEMLSAALAHEAEVARVQAERAELARLRAEQAARESEERERAAAAERARQAAEKEARAKIEAEQRAARERIEAEERKAKAERDVADAAARAVREAEKRRAAEVRAAADAAAKKARDAEDARLRVERERIEAERQAVEATAREARRQADMVLDARAMLATFRDRYGDMPEFKGIAAAIDKYLSKSRGNSAASPSAQTGVGAGGNHEVSNG